MDTMKFKFLEHMADIKFRAYGKTRGEVFENSALALSEYVSKGQKIKKNIIKKLEVKGKDDEEMMYNFMDEIIYLMDADNFILSRVKVLIRKGKLTAELAGDDTSGYDELSHVKAATYAEMYVRKSGDRWEAQVVIDV